MSPVPDADPHPDSPLIDVSVQNDTPAGSITTDQHPYWSGLLSSIKLGRAYREYEWVKPPASEFRYPMADSILSRGRSVLAEGGRSVLLEQEMRKLDPMNSPNLDHELTEFALSERRSSMPSDALSAELASAHDVMPHEAAAELRRALQGLWQYRRDVRDFPPFDPRDSAKKNVSRFTEVVKEKMMGMTSLGGYVQEEAAESSGKTKCSNPAGKSRVKGFNHAWRSRMGVMELERCKTALENEEAAERRDENYINALRQHLERTMSEQSKE